MKKLALLTLATSALAIGFISNIKIAKESKEERDATIIVKMKTNVDNYSTKQLLNMQNSLLKEISYTVTNNYKVTSRYTRIFNGFVLKVPAAYVSDIRSLNRVDMVNYNNIIAETSSNDDGARYSIPLGNPSKMASSSTMEKPEGTNDGAGTFIAILDNGFFIKTDDEGVQTYHNVFAPLDEADALISQQDLKDKIDEAGETFHGHYDEAHTTYYNNKVPFYYDYGGDSSSGTNPDFDVFAEGQDHGTHVASIAGGNAGDEYEGIAPRAQMALMKVFKTYMSGQTYKSGAPSDAILNALEDCLVLGVDTINMSLGSNLNDFDDNGIIQQTFAALREKGTFINVSNGNEGKGNWDSTVYEYSTTDIVETNIIGPYANSLSAMSVAATQADFQFYGEALKVGDSVIQFEDQVVNYRSTSGPIEYNPQRYLKDITNDGVITDFDYVFVPNVGSEGDYTGLDVSGKIAVVMRGDINFSDKVKNAYNRGAIAIIIIDNTSASELNIKMSFGEGYTPEIPVAFALNKYTKVFEADKTNKISFIIDSELENDNTRTVSLFSSDGMKYDLSIKPEISTPGENIKGAIISGIDKYESMSGTSMAAPNMTGATALLLGEHLGDKDYRETINARLMSTATPMKERNEDSSATYTSVRRQGAGLVNLDAALNSQVYLDGLDAEGHRLGKAKVELFNGDDIKEGKINIKFAAINESNEAVTYTAKTYVLAPATAEYDAERYPTLSGQKMQTIEDQLIQTFEDTINVPANAATTITLPEHQVDADKLAALDADFENGCVLEGFTILTAEGKAQLSVPFLGFYGDLQSVSPVEPFDFEKTEGKIYQSDILNYLTNVSITPTDEYDYSKADFRSHIVSGYWSSTSKVSISNYAILNKNSLLNMTDENSNRVNLLGKNPLNNSLSNNFVVGNNGYSNTIVVTQFVTRSVQSNTVTLKSKATGEIVYSTYLRDSIYGDKQLWKSHFDTSMFEEGYVAHRAYGIIPLYAVDGSKFTNFADGEYELEFNYQILAGGEYVKKYDLTIESELPILKTFEQVGESYRLHYSDTNAAVVYVNERPYSVTAEDGGVYADVPVAELAENAKVLVNTIDTAFGQDQVLTHLNDPYRLMIQNKMISTKYDFTCEVTKQNEHDMVFALDITSNGKTGSTNGNIIYRLPVPETMDAKSFKAFSVAANGKEKELKVTFIDGLAQFETTTRTFHITSDEVSLTGISVEASKTDYNKGDKIDLSTLTVTATYSNGVTKVLNVNEYTINLDTLNSVGDVTVTVSYGGKSATFTVNVAGQGGSAKKGGCGGSVIACSAIISIFSIVGASLLALKKRKED